MSVTTLPGGGGGVGSAGGTTDVNLIEIAGNAVAGTGVDGMLAVAGDVADDAAASASYPLKLGAVVDQVPSDVSADGDMAHLIADMERFLRVVPKHYDTLLAAAKNALTNPSESNRDTDPQTVADETNETAVTHYYPSSSGLEIGERKHLTFQCDLTDGTLTFEASNDGTTWTDITRAALDLEAFTTGAASYATVGGTDNWLLDFDHLGARYIRAAVVYPDATNSVDIVLMQDVAF
jgi:hypothetical protein